MNTEISETQEKKLEVGELAGKELCDQLNALGPSGPRFYNCLNAPCYVSYAMSMALPLKVVRWGTW